MYKHYGLKKKKAILLVIFSQKAYKENEANNASSFALNITYRTAHLLQTRFQLIFYPPPALLHPALVW